MKSSSKPKAAAKMAFITSSSKKTASTTPTIAKIEKSSPGKSCSIQARNFQFLAYLRLQSVLWRVRQQVIQAYLALPIKTHLRSKSLMWKEVQNTWYTYIFFAPHFMKASRRAYSVFHL